MTADPRIAAAHAAYDDLDGDTSTTAYYLRSTIAQALRSHEEATSAVQRALGELDEAALILKRYRHATRTLPDRLDTVLVCGDVVPVAELDAERLAMYAEIADAPNDVDARTWLAHFADAWWRCSGAPWDPIAAAARRSDARLAAMVPAERARVIAAMKAALGDEP